MVPGRSQGSHWTPSFSIRRLFPAETALPSTLAVTPCPAISSTSVTRLGSRSFPQALRRETEMGWLDQLSARAAASSSASFVTPSAGCRAVTVKLPWVRVPVLSKTTVSVRARVSR